MEVRKKQMSHLKQFKRMLEEYWITLFDGKERVGWDYKEYKENGETVIDVLQPETYSLKVYFSADGRLTDLVPRGCLRCLRKRMGCEVD
jgi:hypothetical protein